MLSVTWHTKITVCYIALRLSLRPRLGLHTCTETKPETKTRTAYPDWTVNIYTYCMLIILLPLGSFSFAHFLTAITTCTTSTLHGTYFSSCHNSNLYFWHMTLPLIGHLAFGHTTYYLNHRSPAQGCFCFFSHYSGFPFSFSSYTWFVGILHKVFPLIANWRSEVVDNYIVISWWVQWAPV